MSLSRSVRRPASWETGPPGLAAAVSQSPGRKPWGRWERNWEHRRKPARHRRVVASRMRGVVLLDLSRSDGSLPWRGDG
jgi:hypothetical protein